MLVTPPLGLWAADRWLVGDVRILDFPDDLMGGMLERLEVRVTQYHDGDGDGRMSEAYRERGEPFRPFTMKPDEQWLVHVRSRFANCESPAAVARRGWFGGPVMLAGWATRS